MRSLHPGRSALLALTAAAALASSGCPELNRYPDRSVGPSLFSVDDPAGRNARSESAATARSEAVAGSVE
jgi:hypothetical protein